MYMDIPKYFIILISIMVLGMLFDIYIMYREVDAYVPQLYSLYSYGNITIAKLNKYLFTYLGDGYWVLKIPDVDEITFNNVVINSIFFRASLVVSMCHRLIIDVPSNKSDIVVKSPINNTGSCCSFYPQESISIEKIVEKLKRLGIERAEIVPGKESPGNRDALVIIYESPSNISIDVEDIAEVFSDIAKTQKVVVVESMSFGLPRYVEAPDLYKNMETVKCFHDLGESVYGIYIYIDATCINRTALEIGKNFDDMLRDVIDSIKAMDPMIRMYLPHQDIVIVVGKLSPPPIPPQITQPQQDVSEKLESISTDRTSIYMIIIPIAIIIILLFIVMLWRKR